MYLTKAEEKLVEVLLQEDPMLMLLVMDGHTLSRKNEVVKSENIEVRMTDEGMTLTTGHLMIENIKSIYSVSVNITKQMLKFTF